MTDSALLLEYKARHASILVPLAEKLQAHIQEALAGLPRVNSRQKPRAIPGQGIEAR